MQLTAAAVTPPAEHAARRPAGAADAAAADADVMSNGMNTRYKGILVMLALGAIIGCSDPIGPKAEYFTVYADSISAPDTIRAGKDFVVRLWAFVGPDSRYSYSGHTDSWDGSNLKVRLVGIHRYDAVCQPLPSYLYGHELRLCSPDNVGEFMLIFEKEHDSVIQHRVIVG